MYKNNIDDEQKLDMIKYLEIKYQPVDFGIK